MTTGMILSCFRSVIFHDKMVLFSVLMGYKKSRANLACLYRTSERFILAATHIIYVDFRQFAQPELINCTYCYSGGWGLCLDTQYDEIR